MRLKNLCFAGLAAASLVATSCSSNKEILYFQEMKPGHEYPITTLKPIKLQPNDVITIVVSTGDARLNSLFNLPVARTNIASSGSSTSGSGMAGTTGSDSTAPYTIDSQGNINFPVLGKLHVAGMTREELAEYIRRELVSRDLAKNPIVTVGYLNLSVTVLGEVSAPGRYAIDRENYTILDALSSAGDLTIYGKRNNITVLREENGMERVYTFDLSTGKNMTESPVYYLQQNDVVYVEPNDTKARMSTPNGNSALTPTFWISIASFATTIGLLIYNVSK